MRSWHQPHRRRPGGTSRLESLESKVKLVEDQKDPLSKLGLDAIDLRWTLKDIIAKRWMLTPPNPVHVARLIELGLVEMRDDQPVVTLAGQQVIWIPD
jgi:hypothetical protein